MLVMFVETAASSCQSKHFQRFSQLSLCWPTEPVGGASAALPRPRGHVDPPYGSFVSNGYGFQIRTSPAARRDVHDHGGTLNAVIYKECSS